MTENPTWIGVKIFRLSWKGPPQFMITNTQPAVGTWVEDRKSGRFLDPGERKKRSSAETQAIRGVDAGIKLAETSDDGT